MAAPANATLKLEPFTIDIPDKTVDEFKTLLKLSKLPPATYAGTRRELGITSEWMSKAKEEWENNFSW
jgi:microsomal epoxide hydrolase